MIAMARLRQANIFILNWILITVSCSSRRLDAGLFDGGPALRILVGVGDDGFEIEAFALGPFFEIRGAVIRVELAALDDGGINAFVDGLHPARFDLPFALPMFFFADAIGHDPADVTSRGLHGKPFPNATEEFRVRITQRHLQILIVGRGDDGAAAAALVALGDFFF